MAREFKTKKDSGVMVLIEDVKEMLQEGKSFTIAPIKSSNWTPRDLKVLSELLVEFLKKNAPDRLEFSDGKSEERTKGTIAGISKAVASGMLVFASWGKEKDLKIPYLLKPDKVVALTPTVFYLNV